MPALAGPRLRPTHGTLVGYNLRIQDDGLHAPYRPKLRCGAPQVFGHFQVRVEEEETILDYGKGSSGFSPLRTLRDPLRSLDPDCKILLGRSLLQIGRTRRLATPCWFLLERGSDSVNYTQIDPYAPM